MGNRVRSVSEQGSKFNSDTNNVDPSELASISRRSLWQKILDFIFGYDFFISYTWSDGRTYAKALALTLKASGFECFLDSDGYAKGDDWKKVGYWTLRRTSRLVLVGSPNVHESEPVLRELQVFRSHNQQVIPISFDGTLDPDMRVSPLFEFLDARVLRIEERSETLTSGPSESVVDDLRNTFNLMRQSEKRVLILASAAIVLALAFIGAVWFWNDAQNQREHAEQELSQSYARQALGFLESRRNGAGQALLAQARAVKMSPLSDLIGYMISEPMFRPTQRLQLPVDSIDQVWADSDGQFVAVHSSVTGLVTIFDRSGSTPQQLLQVTHDRIDPVFALVGGATPSVIFLETSDDRSFALGQGKSVLKVRRLGSDVEITHPVKTGGGYTSFAKLSDGRYYFINGPNVFALDVAGDVKIKPVSTSLSGYINPAVTSDGASCMMLSNVSGQFEFLFTDGRTNIIWDSSEFLRGFKEPATTHPKGIADADCHHAAFWFDSGKVGRIHLARVLDSEGKLAPQALQSFDADTGDDFLFRNRFFADASKKFVFRRGGKWLVHDTGTGALTKMVDTEMPSSSGTLYYNGKGILVSGFGDVLEYHPLENPNGAERLEVGPQAMTVSGRNGKDGKDWLMTISVDGLLSFWEPEPLLSRYQTFPKPILSPEVIMAFSQSGNWVGYINPSRNASSSLVAASVDGQRFKAELDCIGLVSAAIFETSRGLDVFAGAGDGRLCHFGFTSDGHLVEKDETRTPFKDSLDLMRIGPENRLLVGNMERGNIYLGSTETWPTLTRVALPPRAAGNAITQVEWIPGSRGLVVFDQKRIDFLVEGEIASQPVPNNCLRLVGVTRDGDALLVCRKGDRNVLMGIGQNGRTVTIQTPDSIDAWGASLSPDGKILVAPMRDSDDWPRIAFGKILGHSEGFVFDPALIDELVAINRSGEYYWTNKYPRIEKFLFSSDGKKLFAEMALSPMEKYYFSAGSLDRFGITETMARVGLVANPRDSLQMFTYSSASSERNSTALP